MRTRGLTALAGALALILAGCSGGDAPEQQAPTSSEAGSDTDTSGGDDSASGSDDGGSSTEDSGSDTADADSTPPDADLADTELPVTAEDALSTSADEVGSDGIVHAIELDYSESASAWVWSVKTLVDGTDHKVKIDADTGEVLEHEQESTDDEEQAVDLDSPMTWQEALDKALAEVDGPVRGWKLEWDDQMTAYQFDIGADSEETEVTVNVDSGEVTVDDD